MSEQVLRDRMVMTVLEAQVAPEQWSTLAQTYAAASEHLPPQIVQTLLVQGTADPGLWRVITIWRSRAALDEYRRSVETPGGVRILRSVGAEPTLTIFDVITQHPTGAV